MELPFKEEEISKNIYFRTFYENVESGDLTWHRDREDRFIEAQHETNWSFQMDNELPKNFTERIFVPKGVYHRLIKGKGDLVLKIEKLN